MTSQINKYLIFRLGDEEHAVPLLSVREVSSLRPIRPVPETPVHFLGVTNLRGSVISVISLCTKLGLVSSGPDSAKAILVFDLSGTTVGVQVDEVVSVTTIGEADIEREGHVSLPICADYLVGIAKDRDRLITIIDLSTLLAKDIVQAAA